ncbi:hypothetical protein BGZ75_003265 [Mortierella antarctica]|nr:hypothetical protein BGZ75_003265 [Mortierella antarctica]
MAKLSAKRDKGRGWTASTFLPDSTLASAAGSLSMDMATNLDAISENAMDEDQLESADIPEICFIKSADEDSSNGSSSGSSSGAGESDEDQDHVDHDDDEDESSQDQGTSEDSDDDLEPLSDDGISKELSGRINVPKRARTGLAAGPKKAALSTSPSNPSKIISATPTKKITKKSKKTVKPKGSKGSLSTAAARQATEEAKLEAAKPIVSRFLELENTKLNDKLLQVFMINGMVPYVIESITRLDPEIAKGLSNGMDDDSNQESKFMTRVEQCKRKRDYSDLDLMKKSYTAMNFITRSDVYNEFILSSSHQTVVKELFKIFRPESNGNFYHFQKVFETILKKFRAQTMMTLFEDVDPESGLAKTPLVFDMLPFLDQAPVALAMIKVLFPTYTYGFTEKIQDYYRILQSGHFMEMLLTLVTMTDEPSPSMGDFVVSLLDEATRAKEAKAIFMCLADDPIWAERLAKGVQSSSGVRRHGCIEIIYSILVRSIQMPFQDMFANSIYITEKLYDRVESHLERIANEFGHHLAVHIPDLCHAFIGSSSSGTQVLLPGYTVPSSFTVARLWLLDSIYHCLNDIKDNPLLLESIPDVFWSKLVDSFFQFRFNNAFHVQFYKMFRVVLYSEQAAVYDRFFVKTNFVSRLIQHYRAAQQPTGSRGYIILILNCIRLSADVEAQRANDDSKSAIIVQDARSGAISPMFWTTLLKDDPGWEGFKDTLREATLEQTRDTLCDMDPNLRFQFAPLQSRQPSEAPMTKRHIGIPGISARGNDGIDLGSQYGNSLGFGVPMKYDRAADEVAKEKSEQDQELEVQKALANLMPNVDWKLIPPRRVLDAMSGGSGKNGSKKNGPNGSASTAAISRGDANITELSGDSQPKDSVSGSTKAKKKKKNKKKRQISSVNSEDAGDEDDQADARSRTNGSSADPLGMSSAAQRESNADEKESLSDEDESSVNGSQGNSELSEEERLERKRQKKRERKRKSRMNKKNRTSLQGDASGPDSRPGTADPVTLSEEAQELVQQLVWASIVSPPADTCVQLEHPEFDFCITTRPWRLASKYRILLGGQEMVTAPYKLWFVLSLRETPSSTIPMKSM